VDQAVSCDCRTSFDFLQIRPGDGISLRMSTSLESFVDVLRRSGLVDESVLARNLNARPDMETSQTGENFAEYLVGNQVITAWQAAKLLQGKHKGFFLGKYKLLRLLGKGGMSSVYLAEHVLMRRRCAIKVLPWKLVKDSSYLQRFHREAQAVAALDHPNIVRAYDVDHEKDGNLEIHFLVMEYAEGQNLFDLVQMSGPLPTVTAADYIRQGALGLAHAHKSGMVHRDVKPGNFIVDQHGTVKLMDLGLARVGTEDADHSLTIAHDERVLGTADYLAPEQAVDSHLVDTRADLYSLGCTMYFLLTGRPPFNEGTLTQRLLAHQTKEPTPLESLRPDLPESLLAIIRKLMAKDREQRMQTAEEAASQLAQWLNSQDGVPALPVAALQYAPPAAGSDSPTVTMREETVTPVHAPVTHSPVQKAGSDNNHELGDFLSSLSDVEPASAASGGSSAIRREEVKSTPRMQSEVPLESAESAETSDSELSNSVFPEMDPVFPALEPTFPRTSSGSGKNLKRGDSRKNFKKDTFRFPPERIAWLQKYRYYLGGGAILLLALLGYFLTGRSKQIPVTPVVPTATIDPVTPVPVPAAPTRPAVQGEAITVGPKGNFGTLAEAVAYIQEHAFETNGKPVRQIHIDGQQSLKEAISIDNSGLGSFPRGVRITGNKEHPPRLLSTGKEPIFSLNSIDEFVLENLVLECRDVPRAIVLQGYMSSISLSNITFENVQQVAIAGVGLCGLDHQPAVIQNCRFVGASQSAQAIQMEPGQGKDTRDLTIRNCRFLGPFQSCFSVQGEVDALLFMQNIFHSSTNAIVFNGVNPLRKRLTFNNNTFYACDRGIVFETGPFSSNGKFSFQKNLFVAGTGASVFVEQTGTGLAQLSQGVPPTELNWTDRAEINSSEELNIFASNGRLNADVKFQSTDPGDANFLKPESDELQTVAASSPAPSFIGAVAP